MLIALLGNKLVRSGLFWGKDPCVYSFLEKRPVCLGAFRKEAVCSGLFWESDMCVQGSFWKEMCVCRFLLEKRPVCLGLLWKRDLCVYRGLLEKRPLCVGLFWKRDVMCVCRGVLQQRMTHSTIAIADCIISRIKRPVCVGLFWKRDERMYHITHLNASRHTCESILSHRIESCHVQGGVGSWNALSL